MQRRRLFFQLGFFALFLPALVNWGVPALCMHAAVPRGTPALADEQVRLRRGAWVIVILFGLTVALAVGFVATAVYWPE